MHKSNHIVPKIKQLIMFTTRRTLSRRVGTERTHYKIRSEVIRRRMASGYYDNDNSSNGSVLEEEERDQIIQNIDAMIAGLRTL